MEKAQWSPINSDSTGAAFSPAARKQHPGLTRLPINFSNGTPVRSKKHHVEPSKNSIGRPSVATNQPLTGDFFVSGVESRSPKSRELGSALGSNLKGTFVSTPPTTILTDENVSERLVEAKRHDMGPNTRSPTSMPNSRAGTQTPKIDRLVEVAVVTKPTQSPKPSPIHTDTEVYQAFNNLPPGNAPSVSKQQADTTKNSETRQSSVNEAPGPREPPASFSTDPPLSQVAKPRPSHVEPVHDGQQTLIEQSSSSSDDDGVNPPIDAKRSADEVVKEADNLVVDEQNHITTGNPLPDDHPIEWLPQAREVYRHSIPPFVTKQKAGIRRMVELPLAAGQQYPENIEVVYRFWDAVHSFASIDIDGQRFIVKAFRGGATPYRPWLGPETGFSERALAFAKQVPRGPKSWTTTQGKQLSLPKGWALQEDDEQDDDDYNPAGRRPSAQLRDRRNLNYDLNDEEDEHEDGPYRDDSKQLADQAHSDRSSNEEDYAVLDSPVDGRPDSKTSTARPPSKLINALKKSLRLPKEKEQDVLPRPKQIKRRSIGGQGATAEPGGKKRPKHKPDLSSDSDNPNPHKQTKMTKGLNFQRTTSTNPEKIPQVKAPDSPSLETQTLSSYKQAHTTLRIALVPYPQKSAVQRLRSCMTMTSFFSTVIGVSGYKGDKDHIFGIAATFDGKPIDDADRNMVIREEWQDSFDIFLETVDGAESWTGEGGKCSLSVRLLLTGE